MLQGLIVARDGEEMLRLSEVFRGCGYAVDTATDFSVATDFLLKHTPEVALIDLDVVDSTGLSVIENNQLANVMDIYLMSDSPTLSSAVRGMRAGASDFFEKPVDPDRLKANLESLVADMDSGQDPAVRKSGRGKLVGECSAMRRVYRLIRKVAPTDLAVMLVGESGTGKELAAHTVHDLSVRAGQPFTAINCGAIPAELMESQLFGHVKGAFTGATKNHKGFFERSHGGTLFLDEITEMSPELQVKLLRVLETGHFMPVGGAAELTADVRLVSATNRDPEEAITAGVLREDLYYRLAQFPVGLPPLRERGDDIELLAQFFLQVRNSELGVDKQFGADAIDALRMHDWPGNVRELKNVVFRAHVLAGETIGLDDLPNDVPSSGPTRGDRIRISIGMSIKEVERRLIFATLEHHDGDKQKTADTLGVSVKTLYNRLKQYELE
ncbi:MAG: sigma-54 dependent transcriptional regulator [Gammaproteobacteria bacterium]|nr:sigma-54 dependent transcriptional regulator [Gammaproteobacteria bacterium]NNF61793.1 sigma-54-dependent Fis family transcriptional regulator [Gammaproteobacteria bacterium]NNM19717.1 sigma-54-dependent Fis family transcriptional regulator [Gammaproteobacteria bacterium]